MFYRNNMRMCLYTAYLPLHAHFPVRASVTLSSPLFQTLKLASQGPGLPLALLGQTRRELISPGSSVPAVPVRPWLAEMPGSSSTLSAPSYGSPILHTRLPFS